MVFETKQTTIRPFELEDLDDYFEFCSQENLAEMAGWSAHKTLEESLRSLKKQMIDPNCFAIVYKENGKVIGRIAVQNDSEDDDPFTKELGFSLHSDYRRKHIMQEVVCEIISYLFASDIQNIYACCMQKNMPSKKFIESCGFTFEKEGEYYSESLDETFPSYEYVLRKNR